VSPANGRSASCVDTPRTQLAPPWAAWEFPAPVRRRAGRVTWSGAGGGHGGPVERLAPMEPKKGLGPLPGGSTGLLKPCPGAFSLNQSVSQSPCRRPYDEARQFLPNDPVTHDAIGRTVQTGSCIGDEDGDTVTRRDARVGL
jgi:hypothetical protein